MRVLAVRAVDDAQLDPLEGDAEPGEQQPNLVAVAGGRAVVEPDQKSRITVFDRVNPWPEVLRQVSPVRFEVHFSLRRA